MSKIKLKRGDDESRLVQIKHANDDDTLLPFDLTDTQRADLHAKANGQIVLQLSTQDGSIEWYNRVNGELILNFSHQLHEDADWLNAEYDLQLINKQGKRKTVLSGQIVLSPDVTKVANDER